MKNIMENSEKNFLGIDWGTSKVGVALAHAETRLALAYKTLPNDKLFIANLGELIEKEEIGTIVIGLPHHDKRIEVSFEQEKIGDMLKSRFPVEVVYHDEMFTTKMAQSAMIERGEKHVSASDDAESARIILQSFLDRIVS